MRPRTPCGRPVRDNKNTYVDVSGRSVDRARGPGPFRGPRDDAIGTSSLGALHSMRLLFASIHGYLDPSSGAALATRELLEMLVARGVDCRVLCSGVLDYERETPLGEVLPTLGLPVHECQAALGGGGSVRVLDLTV